MTATTARGLLELTRPVNAVAAGGMTLVGSYVAAGTAVPPTPVALAVGATALATGAGNAINDYVDRDVDRINQPGRPIPRGAVSPRHARLASGVMFAGAVVMALLLPPLAIAIAAVNLVLLVTYTSVFKGVPGAGNVVVAALSGSPFLFGGAAVGAIGPAGVLFVLAALATFAREVVKDVEDVAGDREGGLRTLPIAVGTGPAMHLAALALGLAILASPAPYLLGDFGVAYLLVLLPADALMVWAMRVGSRDPATGHRWLKYGMFLAAIAFVVGRASAG